MKGVLYRVILALTILPMAFGIGVFLLWLTTRWHELPLVGLYAVPVCVFFVVIAAVCLIVYCLRAKKQGEKFRRTALIAVSLIVLNPILGVLVAYSFWYFATQYVLVIENESEQAVSDFQLLYLDQKFPIGDLQPSSQTVWKYHFESDGSLEFEGVVKGSRMVGVVEGYVTHSEGGLVNLIFSDKQGFAVERIRQ